MVERGLADHPGGVFAAGDAVSGPATVVEAVAQGNLVAVAVDHWLKTGEYAKPQYETPRPDIAQLYNLDDYANARRPHVPELALDERDGTFSEVELGFDERTVREEAKRCLRCDLEWLDYMKLPRPAGDAETVHRLKGGSDTMAIVNITINGQKLQARPDRRCCRRPEPPASTSRPCAITRRSPRGGCRMCLVEIEKQRGLQPACTFPVSEGMVVNTATPRVTAARKFVLELLFSERVHYCMYCAMSGNDESTQCELQRLAYQHGLTHWHYEPNTAKTWPVDASRKYFFMDHSRCILCRRCIRACDEVAANHTLGVRERGAQTMVIADVDVPLGESSCVSCGTCLQVCPTGALIDRRSAYMGGQGDYTHTQTTCMACSVGCGIEAVTAATSSCG